MTYTNPADYYDVTDVTKNYSRLLFIAGRGLSAAELNELQDLIKLDLAALGRYLVNNGTVISGGTVTALTLTGITISQASVFVDGHAVQVSASTVAITASGLEIVGMASISSLVTDLDDPTIREGDPNSPNYGNAISYREKINGRWCLSTQVLPGETFFPIITLNNGQIVSVSHTGGDTGNGFEDLLNAYDNETNGSYLLRGLTANFVRFDVSNSPIIGISSGKGRVTGIPVTLNFQSSVALDPINDTKQAVGEPYTYTGNSTYALRYNPISQVVNLQGSKQITVTVTHGGFTGALDTLPNTPVLSLVSVSQGATVYVANTDYKQTGDSVDWSPTGSEPAPGSTYSVTYIYIATFVPSIGTAAGTTGATGVVLDSSNVLVNNSTFYVTYYYYLKRIDLISIDSNGNFSVTRGTPAYSIYQAPPVQASTLSLATVNLINGQTPVISQSTVVNVDRATLNSLLHTVSNLQYSVATLALTNLARNASNPTLATRQIFVDNLTDQSQLDLGLSNNLWIAQGFAGISSTYAVLSTSNLAYNLPYTETVMINQPYYTGKQFINPYASTTAPILGLAALSPNNYTQNNTIDGGISYVRVANGYAQNSVAWWKQNYPNEITNISTTQAGYVVADQTSILTVSGFAANDTITVSFINRTYTAVTNTSGNATVTVTVPAGTPGGNYIAVVTSNLGTVIASAIYSVNATVEVIRYQVVDPIAETIIPPSTFDMSSFQVYVVDLPTDDLVVKVVGLSAGFPDPTNLYVTGRIDRPNIVAGWNTVIFDYPWTLTAFGDYAVIVSTSRPQGTLGTANLGDNDILTGAKLTVNPAPGVMLTSANETTWTASQNQDLTYKANKAVYNTAPYTIVLGTMTGLTSTTDWNLAVQNIIPAGTAIRYYLQDSSLNQYDLLPYNWTYTPPLTGTVTLNAVLTTKTSNSTPLILPGYVLYGGTAVTPAYYTSRQMPISNGVNVPATLTLVVQQLTPSGSSVIPAVQKADATFDPMTFVSSVQIGNNWFEATYTYTGLASLNTRLRFTMNTSDPTKRPLIAQPRLIIN